MKIRHFIFVLFTVFSAFSVAGQGRSVLTDGIGGRDRIERYLLIQVISPQGDTCLVMTDSSGRFEIEPEMMEGMRGNVYLKPMSIRPKATLALESPFDSIDVYRQGRERYLSQDYIVEEDREEPLSFFDPETILLDEATVKAKRYGIARDKVTGYLDSLAILASGEWVCEHHGGGDKYLNDYHGYSHHPHGSPMETGYPDMIRSTPKRGEVYRLIKYIPVDGGLWIVDMNDPPYNIKYTGPQYTEEELLEINGMWKAQGYYPKREYYEPDSLDMASSTPDYRNLLQWKPSVLTDENGVAEIPFSTSDVNTEFVGVVEAVDGTGLIGAQTFTFRVIK